MMSASRGLRSHRCRTPPSRNCATRSRNSRKFQRERLFAASHRLTSWSARECVVMRRTCVAARGESLAAFDGRCIPAGCVAPRSNTPGIAPHRAQHARWGPRRSVVAPFDTGVPSAAAALGWSSGRLARLGATPDFHHGLLTNFTNPDVAESDPVAMILQADVAAHRASVARVVLELARFHPLFPVVAPQLVLDDLHAVQPMLDVAAFDEDARLVP